MRGKEGKGRPEGADRKKNCPWHPGAAGGQDLPGVSPFLWAQGWGGGQPVGGGQV